jgi:hypothetical protein
MLAVVNSGGAEQVVQQNTEQPQTSDQATAATRTAIIWPDPPTAPLPPLSETKTVDQIDATATKGAEPIQQPTSGAAATSAQNNASTNNVHAASVYVISEPLEMSLIAAVGLILAGLVFWIAMKIAGARGRRIIVNSANEAELRDEQSESVPQPQEVIDAFMHRPESDWLATLKEHEFRDPQQRSELHHQDAELIAALQRSDLLTVDDDTPGRLFRNDYELQETPQCRDRESTVADEIGKREDRLEQLKHDLDRLLRSPRVA